MVGICEASASCVCNICTTGMALTLRLRASPSPFDMFLHWERRTLYPNIVEGRAVVRIGIRGAIAHIEATVARVAAFVRIAESRQATNTGA